MYQSLLLICFCLLCLAPGAIAQEEVDYSREGFKSAWYVPDGAVLQHAGNMGMFAMGPHYTTHTRRVAAELLFGFLPRFQAERNQYLITLKPLYQPFRIGLKSGHSITPLRAGIGLSYHFGDQYSLAWHEKYPKGYYWWSTRLRILGYAGSSFNFRLKDQTKLIKELCLYSELGTYDLVLTSLIKEKGLRPWDILNLSVGVRVSF
ncbi:hypothetical protein [Pontibacter beigongshangensis]|uniref:hypothetical protein n=1 Tax=Pontibacter beigongshangensis TaxID=2574733 RepID=UPI00165045EC|nr:hypothetical protein [Pontibacter beigongshangensis]